MQAEWHDGDVEIAPGAYKPACECSARQLRAAEKIEKQRWTALGRCSRLLDQLTTTMFNKPAGEMTDDERIALAAEIPPVLVDVFTHDKLPADASLPALKDAWRDLVHLRDRYAADA